MSKQELAAQIASATQETIISLIPVYFLIVKAILFIVALIFSFIIIGVLLAGKLLLAILQMVAAHQRKAKLLGVTI